MIGDNMHWQNLSDGKKSLWRAGRAWLGPFHFEWYFFTNSRFNIGFYKGGGDVNDEIQVNIALLLFSIWITYHTGYTLEEWKCFIGSMILSVLKYGVQMIGIPRHLGLRKVFIFVL